MLKNRLCSTSSIQSLACSPPCPAHPCPPRSGCPGWGWGCSRPPTRPPSCASGRGGGHADPQGWRTVRCSLPGHPCPRPSRDGTPACGGPNAAQVLRAPLTLTTWFCAGGWGSRVHCEGLVRLRWHGQNQGDLGWFKISKSYFLSKHILIKSTIYRH